MCKLKVTQVQQPKGGFWGYTLMSPSEFLLTPFNSKSVIVEDTHAEPKFVVNQFEYLDGRNYRKSTFPHEQFLPSDDEEIERLQINHLLFKSIFVTPFFSPVEDSLAAGIKVLGVTSGPGWWLIDMAKGYPKSHFTGIDVMIYPLNAPPTNCHFRIMDKTVGLPFPDHSFDLVTQHDVLFKYSQDDWNLMLSEMIRVTKPGGRIELAESGGSIQDIGPNMSIWMMRLTVSLQTRGINLKMATQLASMLEGMEELTDVHSSHRSTPVGWYGRTGDIALECLERLFEAVKPKVCEDWSMSTAKYDKVISTASAECRDFRSWLNIHYVTAVKK